MPGLHDRHPLRWVLLRHTLADGSWHFDWMLERERPAAPDDPNARRLLTLRTLTRPDELTPAAFDAVLIPDHRARYLDYQGPISGGRGRVDRVVGGTCLWHELGGSRMDVQLLTPHRRRWRGEPIEGSDWRFVLESDGSIG